MLQTLAPVSLAVSPAARPLRLHSSGAIETLFTAALAAADGLAGAHCIHELWMRGQLLINIDAALEQLWKQASASIPEWLPMRHFAWLPLAYEVAARFDAASGRSNIYLVLLDYSDSRHEPYGVYVGMSHYAPAVRFD